MEVPLFFGFIMDYSETQLYRSFILKKLSITIKVIKSQKKIKKRVD